MYADQPDPRAVPTDQLTQDREHRYEVQFTQLAHDPRNRGGQPVAHA